MCSWDIISDMVDYSEKKYPEIDILESEKKFRHRVYQRIIIHEIIERCCERPYNDPIEIIEFYELTHSYLSDQFKNDIYNIQLEVVNNLLLYLRERYGNYG